jgi:hypothetical protein
VKASPSRAMRTRRPPRASNSPDTSRASAALLDPPVALGCSDLQEAVWEEFSRIPYGETRHLRPDGRPRIEDAWSVSRPGRTTTREEERIDVKITNAIVAREVTREVTRLLGIAVGEDRQLLELRIPTGLQQSQTARTRYALMRFPIKGSGNTEVFDSLEEAADAWEKITGERPAAAVDLGR